MITSYVGTEGIAVEYDGNLSQDIPDILDAMHTMALENEDHETVKILDDLLRYIDEKHDLQPDF